MPDASGSGDPDQSPDETTPDATPDATTPDASGSGDPDQSPDETTPDATDVGTSLWMNIELRDVATGDSFVISEFVGRPVLVEIFAVWCPVCTRQQQESKKLEEIEGHNIVSVAINADLNEDEEIVQKHIERYGFDWHYAVAQSDFFNSLTDDFGVQISNVPLAPMVLVCGDQTVYKLRNGVKPADELRDKVSELCGE